MTAPDLHPDNAADTVDRLDREIVGDALKRLAEEVVNGEPSITAARIPLVAALAHRDLPIVDLARRFEELCELTREHEMLTADPGVTVTATTEAAGPNHDLFVRVLAQIEKHPETWNQRAFCGTAMCFAGHAVALSGEEWTDDNRAAALLGIPAWYDPSRPSSAFYPDHIFEGDNTLSDLYVKSADILGLDEQVLRDKVAAEVAS
jgi:hypothetical protein